MIPISITTFQTISSVISGVIVGFSLGLIGGGGSVLAVPLLVYFVGLSEPHIAIGTTALAVSLTALYSLFHHHRARNVRWGTALRFAGAGIAGALVGSELGKAVSGKHLLFLFALLMLYVGARMYRTETHPSCPVPAKNQKRVYAYGTGVGILSGFFGIGGGFLIVPALMRSARLPIINAIGSSLVAVSALGATTAASYAWSGLVDWRIAAEYIIGGVVGGWLGVILANRLGQKKTIMRYVFATVVIAVGLYMLWKQFSAL